MRNSGANAVVEGLGDHCCEYMTGGVVLVLGETGRNFGAGMTGGIAYVMNEDESFPIKHHTQFVTIERVIDQEDIDIIRNMIIRHNEVTGSKRAEDILNNWTYYLPLFWEVIPLESLKLSKPQTKPGKEEPQPGAVSVTSDPVSDLKH